MQLLPLDSIATGMILARDVYVEGRIVLRAGVPLSPRFVDRLRKMGIRTAYVRAADAPHDDMTEVADILSVETRQEAQQAIQQFMQDLDAGFAGGQAPLGNAVTSIIDEVVANQDVILQLTEIRAMNDYVFDHSVGVCAIAVLLGIRAGLNRRDLEVMATGALLHDVGKTRITDPVWNKAGKLSEHDFQLIQQHPVEGFQVLREQWEVDLRAAHVAYQHHERFDGSGYPRGLAGDKIHRFARLVAIADVFDALSTDRPYRAAWERDRVFHFMQEEAGKSFDPQLLRTFLGRVAPYPVGTHVRLNTGATAQIVRLNDGVPGRPVIRLQDQPDVDIDLTDKVTWRITGPASPNTSDDFETSSGDQS